MLNVIDAFEVGQLYTNDDIRFSLNVENLGGIRPALDKQGRVRHVAIITSDIECGRNISENPYADRIESDILTYTAAGRQGDQALTGRNKRLIEQYHTPTPFLGFANVGKLRYRFLGLLQLLRHYADIQTDGKGNLRKVWMFEFLIHSSPSTVPILNARSIASALFEPKSEDTQAEDSDSVSPYRISGVSELELEQVRSAMLSVSPRAFELFIARLFHVCGFMRVQTTAFQGDGGIDLDAYVGTGDPFFSGTHVQAQVKRWRHTVGNVEINGFRGALSSTAKGIFISTGYFSRAAVSEATCSAKPSISLLDGRRLAAICIERQLHPSD